MTEVGRVERAAANGIAARARGPESGFTVSDAAPTTAGGEAAGAVQGAAPASLSGLLALQEAHVETPHDREARRRGRDMLAALAELQRALLGGGDSAEVLARLGELAAGLPRASDPGLRGVIAAIGLRARVELARRQPVATQGRYGGDTGPVLEGNVKIEERFPNRWSGLRN